jgi:DNA-binding FadR family transcriptional regulator
MRSTTDTLPGSPKTPLPVSIAQTSFSAVSVTRSYEQVVRQIESAIRSGQLGRGQKLPTERELGASFDVSRGVVREAIKVLSAMGLVEARQGSGLFVRNDPIQSVTRAFVLSVSPNAESVEKLFEFRAGLEREAAIHAATRRTDADLDRIENAVNQTRQSREPLDWDRFGDADNEFHRAIADASGNPYLSVAITTAREMQRDVVNLFKKHPGSIDTAIRHHEAIFAAIRDQDPAAAGDIMVEHVQYTRHAVQTNVPLLSGSPDPPSDGESP